MKKGISITTGILATLLFTVHVLASARGWYYTLADFDKYMHFFGGMFVFFALMMYGIRRNKGLMRIVLLVVIVGVLWEVYEYIVQYYTGAHLATIPDSLSDLFFDTFGAVVSAIIIFFVQHTKKRYNTYNAQR